MKYAEIAQTKLHNFGCVINVDVLIKQTSFWQYFGWWATVTVTGTFGDGSHVIQIQVETVTQYLKNIELNFGSEQDIAMWWNSVI